MANFRSHAQFDRAKWRFIVLVPIWVLQLGLTMALASVFAYRLGDTYKYYDERDKKGELPKLEVAWEATNMALAAVATVCTIYEIARYVGEALTPWTMLFTHVIKLTCGLGILALDVVVLLEDTDKHYTVVSLALDVAFIITGIALVIYTVRIYLRLSKLDDYHHQVGVKSYGFSDGLERGDSLGSRFGSIRPTMDKGGGRGSISSRLSIGSRNDSYGGDSKDPVPLADVERRHSLYSHERDTKFDDYVARRGSVSGGAVVVTPPSDSEENGALRSQQQQPQRPRGGSAARAPSWADDHVLVSVPEEDDDEHHHGGRKETRADMDKKDREALLSEADRRDSHDEDVDAVKVPQEVDIAEPKWQRQ